MIEILLGPPGTGKTTALLNEVEKLLAAGVDPDRMGFLAFTRKAASEAKERALRRFEFETDDPLPWFRTIHSLAFRRTGVSRNQIVTPAHLRQICSEVGFEYKADAKFEDESRFRISTPGNFLVFLENLSRVTERALADVWEASPNMRRDVEVGLSDLVEFKARYVRFKATTGFVDHTDTLLEFLRRGNPPDLEVVIVDEAQDLSKLQWAVVWKVAAAAKRVIVAGDDHQAIFRWSGAHVEAFLDLEGEVKVLEQSFRIPAAVHDLAASIATRIGRRRARTFKPREVPGMVEFVDSDDELDAAGGGTWLFLARHGFQLPWIENVCRREGWFYSMSDGFASNRTEGALAVIAWENLRRGGMIPSSDVLLALKAADLVTPEIEAIVNQAPFISRRELPVNFARPWYDVLTELAHHEPDYFRQARDGGDRMTTVDPDTGLLAPAEPRIKISTIHGAKGGEADSVYLMTDVSESTHRAMELDESDESRVFYVGATRARERLIIRRPATALAYEMQEV